MMGFTLNMVVLFGLIMTVGMLVDGAIVVVEYADKRIKEGTGPMHAYVEAAQRMFWPVVSSTATTLCAFLPMLFWPGVPGEFMGMLPVTLIFVLSASLIVALIYLPVLGGVAARYSRLIEAGTQGIKALLPWWPVRAVLTAGAGYLMFLAALETISPGGLFPTDPTATAFRQMLPGMALFVAAASLMSVMIGSVAIHRAPKRIRAGYRRSPFGWIIHAIVGNPVMPLVTIGAVGFIVVSVFFYFQANNNGVEFFVESEPENGIVYVRARGNLSVEEMDLLVRQVETRVIATEGVRDVFAFAGQGGLNNNTGGAEQPRDTIGQVQFDLLPWEDRPVLDAPVSLLGGLIQLPRTVIDPAYDGDTILAGMQEELDEIPGIRTEIFSQSRGPASGKPVSLRLAGDNWEELQEATRIVHDRFEATPALTLVENTLPLPGVDWELTVDVEAAGRYGANVAAVGAMVQLVTRGILLDTMRVPTSDEEIEIRVRFPEEARVLSTLDTLRVRTADGLVPLANFVTRTPAPQLAEIDRRDQSRIFNIRADVLDGLVMLTDVETGETRLEDATLAEDDPALQQAIADGELTLTPVNANERIAALTEWLETENPLPASVSWEWGGDQEEEAESQAFLGQAFLGALGLMFIILLAQFNSVYNSVLVLLAVVLSTVGVLIGMLVMDQTFSIIMTGTGIVALAGIVVNNNIVLIDTYQEYSRYMPQLEAITRTAEARIRPVLLTTITTMAGLMPMMYGISLDFAAGGYSVDSPTALWWKQLATAVVFGLGVATVLTLVLTPSLLALRVWFWTIVHSFLRLLGQFVSTRGAQDWVVSYKARNTPHPEILWEEPPQPVFIIEDPAENSTPADDVQAEDIPSSDAPLRAAE